jgi:GAF domain-containing protein
MSDSPQGKREIDTMLLNARQLIDRLISQLGTGKVDPVAFNQRLATLGDTIDKAIEERKQNIQNERLARLYKVSRLISASYDLQNVLEHVMDAIVQLTGAERGFLMLLENEELVPRVERNFNPETQGSAYAFSRSVLNKVLSSGQSLLTTNAVEDERFAGQASIIVNSLSSIMASPLRSGNKIIGAIYIDNRALKGLFTEDDLQLLELFGEQAALAIENSIEIQHREQVLQARIEELRIEIDEAKKSQQVAAIVETEYFQNLRAKVSQLRQRTLRRGESKGSDEENAGEG